MFISPLDTPAAGLPIMRRCHFRRFIMFRQPRRYYASHAEHALIYYYRAIAMPRYADADAMRAARALQRARAGA